MRNANPTGSRPLALVIAAAVVLAAIGGVAGITSAAGTTDLMVSFTDGDETVAPGETTTARIVVDSADGGVGAAEFRVAVADASVAEITGVTVRGSGATETDLADDGSSVDVEYAFRDTADTGSVVIAEVTLRGTERGTTDVTIAPAEGNDAVLVFDENGSGYDVSDTNAAELSVASDGDGNGPPTADAGSDQTAEAGTTVHLDASGSSDPDASDALSYAWTQTAGPDVSLSDAGTVRPRFVAPDVAGDTTLTFAVEVSDGTATDTDTVDVTVQPVDETAPSISDFDVTADAQDVDVSVTVDEELASLVVTLGGDASGTLSLSEFEGTDNGDGTFTYTADVSTGSDGTFSATLTEAADADGNDGAGGQSDSVTVAPGNGQVSVRLSPASRSLDVGTSTTYDVVVGGLEGGGVGAFDLSVSTGDPAVATIVEASLVAPEDAASPGGTEEVTVAPDGTSVSVRTALRDTTDSGTVTVARVTVDGAGEGTTDLDLTVHSIGSEDGINYRLGSTTDATVGVEPVSLRISNLEAPDVAAPGDAIDVSADVSNDGAIEVTRTVEFRFDLDGDGTLSPDEAVSETELTVDGGATETVAFLPSLPEATDIELGEYAHGVFSEDASATATITVAPPPIDDDFAGHPTSGDSDPQYEDVNGDGAVDVVDVQALFANLDNPLVTTYADRFDYNGNGAVDVVDVQYLFDEEIGGLDGTVSGDAIDATARPSTAVSLETAASASETAATIDSGESTTFVVTVDSAAGGVGAYNLSVGLENDSVGTITDVAVGEEPGVSEVDHRADRALVRAALTDTPNDGDVDVVGVTVRGDQPGTTDLSLSVNALGTESGVNYDVTTVEGASLTVVDRRENPFPGGVPGVADEAPTDVDGDALHEDVNGDGAFNLLDVIDLLFADWRAINRDADGQAAVDFDRSGNLNFLDVVTLLFEL
jgi:hypothetical protein